MNSRLFKDDYGTRIWVIITTAGLAVGLVIAFLVWVTTQEERHSRARFTECIERTDDAMWCWEVTR